MKKMTKRQQEIEAGRISDVEQAARMAFLINEAWGDFGAWAKSCPKRQWIRGANGLWHSLDPKAKLAA